MDMSFSTRKGFIAVALLAATAPGTNALVTGASAGHQQLRSLKPRLSSSAAVPRLSSAGGGRGGYVSPDALGGCVGLLTNMRMCVFSVL